MDTNPQEDDSGSRSKTVLRVPADQRDRHATLRQLADAEGWVCHICMEPVERLHDASRDHVPPYSKGGRTVRLAHKRCNSEAGNR